MGDAGDVAGKVVCTEFSLAEVDAMKSYESCGAAVPMALHTGPFTANLSKPSPGLHHTLKRLFRSGAHTRQVAHLAATARRVLFVEMQTNAGQF